MAGVGAVGDVNGDPGSDPRLLALSPEMQAFARQKLAQGQTLDQILPNLGNEFQASQVTQLPSVGSPAGAPRNPILAELDKNPATAGLPEATKAQIAGDLNNPLNPRNPNFVFKADDALGREAQAEQVLREAQAAQQREQIGQFATEFETSAEARRKALADRLAQQTGELETAGEAELGRYGQDLATSRQKTFEQANPFILEDLNRRGLLTSETAVGQAQAQKLADLQAQDEAKLAQARLGLFQDTQGFREGGANLLNEFDTGVFSEGQNIRGGGLEAYLGGNQAALDEALGLRRSKIERDFGLADTAAERAFASSQAKKNRQNQLLGAGISAGGNIGSAFLSQPSQVATASCFDRWTKVDMPDGTQKSITEIKLGDHINGGIVQAIRIAQAPIDDVYFYKGVVVTGSHAVKEKERWLRIKDTFGAVKCESSGPVYNLITSDHRIFVDGIEFADEIETDGGQYTSMDESLLMLNNEEVTVDA